MATSGCTEGPDRFTTRSSAVEARVDGELPLHYAWIEAGTEAKAAAIDPAAPAGAAERPASAPTTLVIVSPYHASASRNEFTAARLAALFGSGRTIGFAACSFICLPGATGALALGTDGIALSARGPAGRFQASRPSELLAGAGDLNARELLSTLTGAGRLPAIEGGQSVTLLMVVPTDLPFAEWQDLTVTLPDRPNGEVPLLAARASAARFDEFRSQPSRERFEIALGLRPAVDEGAK